MNASDLRAMRERSATFRRLNPEHPILGVKEKDIRRAVEAMRPAKPHPGSITGQSSKLSSRFELLWKLLNGPPLAKEKAFHPTRKWRFDYLHEKTDIAIEINGSQWVKGGHNSGTGLHRDAEKANAALVCGYALFTLTTDMITREHIQPIIDYIVRKEAFLEKMGT